MQSFYPAPGPEEVYNSLKTYFTILKHIQMREKSTLWSRGVYHAPRAQERN